MKPTLLIVSLLLIGTSLVAQAQQVKVSELVSLRSSDSDACPVETFPGARLIDDRLMPDASTQPFTVPEGSVFVVTEVVFRVSPYTSFPVGITPVRLGTPCSVPSSGCMKSWIDAVVPEGTGELRISLQHGIVIAAGTPICVAGFDGNPNTFAEVYGRLAQAPPGQ